MEKEIAVAIRKKQIELNSLITEAKASGLIIKIDVTATDEVDQSESIKIKVLKIQEL